MKRLGPGVYDDGRGNLHLECGELLAAYGYADTPRNRAALLEALRDVYSGLITETDEPIMVDDEADRG